MSKDLDRGAPMPNDDAAIFRAMSPAQKRAMHFRLCATALETWRQYTAERPAIFYVESVTGTQQSVEIDLPEMALEAAARGADDRGLAERFREPICAINDGDLIFPDRVEDAYDSLYHLFQKYALGEPIDDWLIVNQALASAPDESLHERFRAAVAAAIEMAAAPESSAEPAGDQQLKTGRQK